MGENTKKAWRFLDAKANGSIDIEEFKEGLGRLQVNMSNEDIDKTFSYLDRKRKGNINYNDFCKICDVKKKVPS